jgi:tRNA 5-methylaminomethyl-2-thiouridine biosynthesis bifunctional protein
MTPRPVAVVPARLEHTAEGVAFSPEFQDIYHSRDGGLAQARHVFLGGNALPRRWRGREGFTILETGFGLGLNFLCAWQAWREDGGRCARLHFVSVENHPFARADLAAALAPFEELGALARALCAAWPPPIAGFHRLAFEGGQVVLTLILGDARAALPELEAAADAFFLDGFAPARNPEMWSPEVVREIARLAAPGATLATWTVAGGVRSALAGAGFRLEKRAGFGAKREMLAGARDGEAQAPRRERRAAVVGAGLAGTLAGERLAARGGEVVLVDARPERAAARAGLVRPIVNLRDALNAQLSREAFLHALQHYRALYHDGYHLAWNRCGVLQLADDAEEEERFAAIARSQGHPPDFLEYVDAARASALARRPVARGGWWFPMGAVVSPPSLAVASQARAGARLRRIAARRVERLAREGAQWRALDADARVIAEAPVLIVASAADAARLLPEARLKLSAVRGQVTYLPGDASRALDVVVSGNGYVAPLFEGEGHAIGASYAHEDFDERVRVDDHRGNLARAESMLPGFTAGVAAEALTGWTGFRATVPDRLPIFGETALDAVFAATGLGSRGLLWAPLGAELLASSLAGEPLPLSRSLAGAISPKRFLS